MASLLGYLGLGQATLILVTILIILVTRRVIYNLYFHPLAKIPGPILARATGLYESYFEAIKSPGGQYVYEVDRLHKIYGPIVRIRPGELHVKDLEFYDQLYAFNSKRDKDPRHVGIFGTPLSLFGTELHDVHRPRRLAMNPFFSVASVLALENLIRDKVQKMVRLVSASGKRREDIPIRRAFIAVTMDIISEYSFARSTNALEEKDYAPKWEAMMSGVSEAVPLARSIPGIVQFLQALPHSVIRSLNPLMGAFFDYVNIIRGQVAEAIQEHHSGDIREKTGRRNVFQDLLQSKLPESEKTEERLTQEGVGFVSAGSETTAFVMSIITYYTLANPSLNKRLHDELFDAIPDLNEDLEWQKLEKLPLLSSIVKEGLRISTPIVGRLPLKAQEAINYNGYFIPPNTSISMTTRDALLHPEIFPEPNEFNPDRWIDASAARKKQMEKAFIPFNKGPRMCIGFNLAYADIYHNIGSLFRRFEFEIVNANKKRDIDMARDHFIPKATRESPGWSIRVTKEYDH